MKNNILILAIVLLNIYILPGCESSSDTASYTSQQNTDNTYDDYQLEADLVSSQSVFIGTSDGSIADSDTSGELFKLDTNNNISRVFNTHVSVTDIIAGKKEDDYVLVVGDFYLDSQPDQIDHYYGYTMDNRCKLVAIKKKIKSSVFCLDNSTGLYTESGVTMYSIDSSAETTAYYFLGTNTDGSKYIKKWLGGNDIYDVFPISYSYGFQYIHANNGRLFIIHDSNLIYTGADGNFAQISISHAGSSQLNIYTDTHAKKILVGGNMDDKNLYLYDLETASLDIIQYTDPTDDSYYYSSYDNCNLRDSFSSYNYRSNQLLLLPNEKLLFIGENNTCVIDTSNKTATIIDETTYDFAFSVDGVAFVYENTQSYPTLYKVDTSASSININKTNNLMSDTELNFLGDHTASFNPQTQQIQFNGINNQGQNMQVNCSIEYQSEDIQDSVSCTATTQDLAIHKAKYIEL